MSIFSTFAGDGGDMLGGFRSRSTSAEENIEVSPIKEEGEVAAAAARDWSSLPEPAIQLILMGLRPSLGDVFNFAGVCKAWRSVFTDCKRELFPSLPPLLVDCGSSLDAIGRFYCLVDQGFLRWARAGGSLPLSDWRVIGVSHGYWIVTPMKNSYLSPVFLLDPLFPESSRIELPLPPRRPFYHSMLVGEAMFVEEFSRVLMTAPPTSPDCLVVATTLTHCIWYCRPGDTEWVRHELDDVEWMAGQLRQVAVLGRQLYALVSFRKLVVVELLFPRPRVAVVDVEGLMPFHFNELDRMVESDGEILYIAADLRCSHRGLFEHYRRMGGRPRSCEHRYVVQRLDLPARRWVALDTLGKRSIFLSGHEGWGHCSGTPLTCTAAAEWGGREDCIYSECIITGTLAVWSMKDGRVEDHRLPDRMRPLVIRRHYEWLMPSFCYT